jgi:cytochrome d ubiquinol oxidase subunit I
MNTALGIDRFQFAFTITFHYIFPQLTMGLALLLVILKTLALRTGDEHYRHCARFWTKIFAINFAVGVVTGIPMEFQFGTNWAQFSKLAGGVIGQTLTMEGVFSFFLESTFLGLLLFGEKRLWGLAALVLGGGGVCGVVAIGIFHHRHGCLDAESGWLHNRRGWAVRVEQYAGVAF